MNGTPTGSVSIRFRPDVFDQIVEPCGHETLRDKADLIGCSVSNYYRVISGKQRPGSDFIAKVAAALPEVPITQLFDFGVGSGRAA